jgi:hypothetical protein
LVKKLEFENQELKNKLSVDTQKEIKEKGA